jgi:branched-chain amino acid transport system ATP-binding protein
LLQVNNICVNYGEVPVLRDISLTVERDQIISVLGANGAGKTTLLRAISGFLRPVSGAIRFMEADVTGLESSEIVDRGLIRIPEGRKLFSSLTVLENLELGSYNKKARNMRKDSLEKVYGLFPILGHRRGQVAGTLSGGEQQMLAIARALMSLPRLLMLDEPSLGLSPILVDTIFEIISKISKQGTTVLLVEQNIYNSLLMADKGYVMENGRIVLEGDGKALLENEHIKRAYLGI